MGFSGCISKRSILWHLVFWGFAVNYMIRINLNIAIVAMVAPRRNIDADVRESECFVALGRNLTMDEDGNHTLMPTQNNREDVFPWDEYQQGLILGAFFWLNWTLQLPGGILASRYGTKIVFGLGNLLISLMSLLIPLAAYLDYRVLVLLRVVQGLVGGVCWPSMHNMAANWIPPNERSKFFTSYLGSSIGAGLTFPFCGLLIDRFDWPAAFYVTGLIGMGWFVAWWCLVYDSPAQHPHIDPAERQYIEDSLGQTVLKEKPPVPWKHILTSRAIWSTIAAQVGGLSSMFTILIQAPTYFKFIHGMDVRMTGFLSGLPHFTRVLFALVFSTVADDLLRRNKVSRDFLRKFATVVCTIGQGLFVMGLAFCGCNWLAAVLLVSIAISLHGAVSTGPLAVFADISPNYASISFGFAGSVAVIPGFLSPLLVGALTYQNQTIGQWQKVFLIVSAISSISGLVFVLFASTSLQPWNNPDTMVEEDKSLKKVEEIEGQELRALTNGKEEGRRPS